MTLDLAGRSALVTGASQGLGRAIAIRLAQAGANVLLTARSQETLDEARLETARHATRPGQVVDAFVGDVGDAGDCTAAVARALDRLPGLHVLVNNAGVYGPMGPIEDVDWSAWVDAIRINLFGTVLMCRAAIPHFRRQAYGKIVNLSGGGATAPLPRISAYAASKVAVVRLTETFAEELREARVDVNAIAPGALNTRLLDEVLEAGPEKVGRAFYLRSLEQRDKGGAPLAKAAELVAFLASSSSDGISGRLLSALWDDWEGLPARREKLAGGDVYTLRRIVPEDRGWPGE